jgi:prevent-host-death family protein
MCYMARKAKPSTVGVRELRQNLSVYLDRVKKGEALTVTEHGAAVALLSPLSAAASALDRLVAAGTATRPIRSVRDLPRPLKVRLDRALSDILDDMRGERV